MALEEFHETHGLHFILPAPPVEARAGVGGGGVEPDGILAAETPSRLAKIPVRWRPADPASRKHSVERAHPSSRPRRSSGQGSLLCPASTARPTLKKRLDESGRKSLSEERFELERVGARSDDGHHIYRL